VRAGGECRRRIAPVAISFLQNLPRLREFLHRMGRETNQGEVAFEFAGRFYRIRMFDTV